LIVALAHSATPMTYAGTEGCTPGYWKNNTSNWPPPFTPETRINAHFAAVWPETPVIFPGDPTMLQALGTGGGGIYALLRHTAAGLLNAAAREREFGYVDYHLDVPTLRGLVVEAFLSGDYESLKDYLESLNEGYCPLG